MAFIPCPNIAKGVVQFKLGTETWSNTFWAHKMGFSLADQEALAAILGAWGTDHKAHIADDCQYVQTDVYDMNEETGAVVTDVTGAGAGALTSEVLPLQAAMVVTLYTNNRGKSGRGRLYVGGFTETFMTNGAWTTALRGYVLGDLQTAWDAMATAGWTWSVVSLYHDHAARNEGLGQAINTIQVRDLKPGTQRRRVDRT